MRAAFVTGMDAALLVSAGIAAIGIVLTLLFLPHANKLSENQPVPPLEERELVTTG